MSRTILIAGGGPLTFPLASRLTHGTEDRVHAVLLEAGGLADAGRLPDHIDEVWHAGARLGPALRRAREAHERDLRATQALLDLVRERKCRALNLVSTVFVAGARPGTILEGPFDARFPASHLFEQIHRAAESSAEALCRAEGIRLRVFRVGLPTTSRATEDAAPEGFGGFLSILCRFKEDIENKLPGYFHRQPLRLLASAEATPPFIDADRAAEIMVRIARSGAAQGYFNIAGAAPAPLGVLCERIGEALGVRIELTTDPGALDAVDDLLRRRLAPLLCYLQERRPIDSSLAAAAAGSTPSALVEGEPAGSLVPGIEALVERWRRDREASVASARRVLATMASHTIDGGADGPLTYFSLGPGDSTVILVNALGQGLFIWSSLILRLSRRYRVIAWEPRGTFGQRPFGLIDQVADLKRIIAQEQADSHRLVCWCNGARTALELLRQGGAVASLVILNGSFKPFPELERLYTTYEQTMGQLCEMVSRKPALVPILMKSLNSVLSGSAGMDPGIAAGAPLDAVEVLGRTGPEIKEALRAPFVSPGSTVNYSRQITDLSSYDITAVVRETTAAVLLIAGQLDQVASAEMSRAISSILRNAECIEIIGGTHYCMQENPELVADLVEAFFEGGGGLEDIGAEVIRHREAGR